MKQKSCSSALGSKVVVGALAALAYALVLRPRHLRWGATDEEVHQTVFGDDLAPARRRIETTRAITIYASMDKVWPWLVQMGQNKGGFYSYSWLENLCGCHLHNADRIVPEWQELNVGDDVWLHPKAPPLKVLAVEPGHAIVLEKCWTFALHTIDDQTTRLLVRSRSDFNPDLKNPLLNFLVWRVVFEPAHFIMERKMMLGLKARAEAAAGVKP